jgi:hypothetical protein
MAKDAGGHGSEKRGGGMPLEGHPYHQKSNAELRYIAKDANEAAQAMRGHSPQSEGKYLDQVNDASTVLGFRQRGGADLSQDKQAAAKLAEGGAPGKNTTVPVHSSMVPKPVDMGAVAQREATRQAQQFGGVDWTIQSNAQRQARYK